MKFLKNKINERRKFNRDHANENYAREAMIKRRAKNIKRIQKEQGKK